MVVPSFVLVKLAAGLGVLVSLSWPVERLVPKGAVVRGPGVLGKGNCAVGSFDNEGGAVTPVEAGIAGGETGAGAAGTEGAAAIGGGVIGVGGLTADTGTGGGVAVGGVTGAGGLGAPKAESASAEGGGGSFAGALMGAEVAMGSGTEGRGAGLTSSGCVTAARALCEAGKSTSFREPVGRLTRTGAVVPSGSVGRPGAATMPEEALASVVGAGTAGAGCESGGWGGIGIGGGVGLRGGGFRCAIEGADPEGVAPGGCSGSVFRTMEIACVEARAGALVLWEIGSRLEAGVSR
jgi:hypothetical protein